MNFDTDAVCVSNNSDAVENPSGSASSPVKLSEDLEMGSPADRSVPSELVSLYYKYDLIGMLSAYKHNTSVVSVNNPKLFFYFITGS